MSVDIEAAIVEAQLDPKEYVINERWVGAVSLRVGDVREVPLKVGFHPIEENPYHGEIWGDFTSGTPKRLQRLATWYVEIDGVDII